jgi:hypothetical protein
MRLAKVPSRVGAELEIWHSISNRVSIVDFKSLGFEPL